MGCMGHGGSGGGLLGTLWLLELRQEEVGTVRDANEREGRPPETWAEVSSELRLTQP